MSRILKRFSTKKEPLPEVPSIKFLERSESAWSVKPAETPSTARPSRQANAEFKRSRAQSSRNLRNVTDRQQVKNLSAFSKQFGKKTIQIPKYQDLSVSTPRSKSTIIYRYHSDVEYIIERRTHKDRTEEHAYVVSPKGRKKVGPTFVEEITEDVCFFFACRLCNNTLSVDLQNSHCSGRATKDVLKNIFPDEIGEIERSDLVGKHPHLADVKTILYYRSESFSFGLFINSNKTLKFLMKSIRKIIKSSKYKDLSGKKIVYSAKVNGSLVDKTNQELDSKMSIFEWMKDKSDIVLTSD